MSIKKVLKSKTFEKLLLSTKLKFVSTERQIQNGTIALAGKIKKKAVSYSICASGAVLSNKFVARRVNDYREGLEAVSELVSKRQ
jgi:hypothetical protein